MPNAQTRFHDEDRQGTILVVDDEELIRLQLRVLLEECGHRVLVAASGQETLHHISTTDVDVVLLDVLLPDMDGFEVCRRIRQDPRNLVLPVVFVTSLEDREARLHGKKVGGDDFLTKPVDDVELIVRVRNLLKLKAFHDNQRLQQEQLEVELEKMQEQLIRVERLATLGTLAAGIGHELSNATGVLKVTAQFIRRDGATGQAPKTQDLDNLDRVAAHLSIHAQHLLNMGRPSPRVDERIDLCEVIETTLQMLRIAGKTKHQCVETALPKEPLAARVNRTELEQVLINLVINAADATRESVAQRSEVGRIAVTLEGHRKQGWVAICVRDNGPGFPSDLLDRVFEPYVTTKLPGEGTGLGLTVVRQIVRSYGGEVVVGNDEGGGGVVEVVLPTASA